ncbi:MAG: cobalt transporter CbiM [Desulfohalobiaceae bacterium]|nr:cobalt transporter CbiM [Desulfohalobiaceae bacterium]
MHISEGLLSPPILVSGAVLCLCGTAYGLKKMDADEVPRTGILTAAFFVASLIHVPIGPASIHLLLVGLAGILLGWSCFPALLVALFLQALFFQYGGLTVLGVNTVNMALPALLVFFLFTPLIRHKRYWVNNLGGFLAGSLAILGSGVLTSLSLALSGEPFVRAAQLILLAHLPLMLIEGFITAVVVTFIKKVRPEILQADPLLTSGLTGHSKERARRDQ